MNDDEVEEVKPGPSLHPRKARFTYGVIAEFPSPETLLHAIHQTRAQGYEVIEAYTPYPIEEVWEAIGHPKSRVPLLVLFGGLAGCIGGYFLQYWVSVLDYPLNIGGKPYHSAPAFIVPTFECTILFAAFAAVLGMLGLNGLPMPYHPVFSVPRFALASRDRFFLCIESADPLFDAEKTKAFLASLGAREVTEVED